MNAPEPVPPGGHPAPLRPEDGPQDVSQEPGSIELHTVTDFTAAALPVYDPGREALLTVARSQIGTLAKASGWTPYGQWYADRHHRPEFETADFCDMFCSWCGSKAGYGDEVGECAWCPSHAARFAGAHELEQTQVPGALVFYNWEGHTGSPDDAEHVGILETTRPDGRIVVIEANTRKDGTGPIGVWRRVRQPRGAVIGYGVWSAEEMAMVVSLGA